jgi:glycosyltransferase involved in cell wall biosynthesis
MKSVDVIVPCYNYGRFLPDCVGSVLSQHEVQVRVLIIDDASADDSAAVARRLAEEDGRVSVIQHQTNQGHIATYNEGLRWVEADYMLLLSADDVLAPGALWRAASMMEAHRDVGLTYGRAIRFVDFEKPVIAESASTQLHYSILSGSDFIEKLCVNPTNPVETATAIVRTGVQKRVGGYRRELPHAGDLEMWLRFAAMGRVALIDEVQAFTRIHHRNMRHAYAVDRMLGDYAQRFEAFRMFFAAYADKVPRSRRLSAIARRSLAEEILWAAARAFEEDEQEAVPRLAHSARSVHPQIVLSPLWGKLSLRRLVGPRCWRAVTPWIGKVRTLYGAAGHSGLEAGQRITGA